MTQTSTADSRLTEGSWTIRIENCPAKRNKTPHIFSAGTRNSQYVRETRNIRLGWRWRGTWRSRGVSAWWSCRPWGKWASLGACTRRWYTLWVGRRRRAQRTGISRRCRRGTASWGRRNGRRRIVSRRGKCRCDTRHVRNNRPYSSGVRSLGAVGGTSPEIF